MIIIIFEDYTVTKSLYHVVSIVDLKKTLEKGIKYDDKSTYIDKYFDFHAFFDMYRPDFIPDWVERKKAVFASLNFKDDHSWHSHSAILRISIDENKAWICNENIANFLYEPFILKNVKGFEEAKKFVELHGKAIVENYWSESLSFKENLRVRKDKKEGYDAEVLIFHDIAPENIECLFIVSDHRVMTYREWKQFLRNC